MQVSLREKPGKFSCGPHIVWNPFAIYLRLLRLQVILPATAVISIAICDVLPEMSQRVKNSLLEAIKKAVDEGIKQIGTELEKVVSEKVDVLNGDVF